MSSTPEQSGTAPPAPLNHEAPARPPDAPPPRAPAQREGGQREGGPREGGPRDAGPRPPAPVPSRTTVTLDAQTNAEIEAAMRDLETAGAAQAGHAPHDPRPPRPRVGTHDRPVAAGQIRGPRVVQAGREVRPGAVVAVGPVDIFLEFGPKELGVVPRAQWTAEEAAPKVGETIEVVVDRRDDDGLLNCSRPNAIRKADWELLEPGQVVEAKVVGVNKGGLELEIANHRAFMPASQVALEHVADLNVFVGEKFKCRVTRIERTGRGNIVLSRRDLLEEDRRAQGEKLKTTLAEGQVVEGVVRKIMPFGAFVDLGGVDGLVHLSDLTHERVGHGEKAVGRFVKAGEKVRVQILKLDWEGGRISLGMKQTQSDPFAVATNEIKDGAEVTGRVTKIMEFGAFVEVAPGVEGLVHISELAWRRVGTVGEVVKADEVVKAKVLRIDPESRRISLSIKALLAPPEPVAPPGGGGGGGGGRGGPGGFGGQGGFGGRGGKGGRRGREDQGRPIEEIQKVSPELRRLREKFGGQNLKGGIA
ncbi:MAG: 30S ribosomal protein S1 [Phycisphaerales bacterium]